MKILHFFLSGLFICSLAGCTTFGGNGQSPQKGSTVPNQQITEQEKKAASFYYDFDDVQVPKDMKLQAEESLMFETPHVKAGLLSFSGSVEPVSLFNFFRVNMPKDGWQMRSYFKYGRYIIVFEKPEKDCILSIVEGHIKTNLEIWITPRVTGIMQTEP